MILISQNTPKCTRSAAHLYDFTTLRRDIMKERALEVQQERERHAKDVEVDDDEEQKKAKAATEDDEIRRQLLQQLTDREQQQQKKKALELEIRRKSACRVGRRKRAGGDGQNSNCERRCAISATVTKRSRSRADSATCASRGKRPDSGLNRKWTGLLTCAGTVGSKNTRRWRIRCA